MRFAGYSGGAPAARPEEAPPMATEPATKHPNRDPSREHPTITADDAATASPIELDDPPESAVGEEDPGAADDVAADDGNVPRDRKTTPGPDTRR